MSNRKGADLGLTLVNLGYVAPTLTSLGGAKSTVAAGLPSLVGRNQGDLHRNLTDGLEYELVGTFATSDSDNFNRADGAIGSTSGGARAWVADGSGGTRPTIAGNAAVQRANGVRGGHLINLGSAAAGGLAQATVHLGPAQRGEMTSIALYLGTGTAPDAGTNTVNGGWIAWVEMSSGANGLFHLYAPDGATAATAVDPTAVLVANETATFSLEVSTDGKTAKGYKNGVLVLTLTSASAPTGTYTGFQMYGGASASTGSSYLDDFSASVGGSVGWTSPAFAPASTTPKLLASTSALASVDFANIPATFKHLLVVIQGATSRGFEFDSERMTLNGDGGANYEYLTAQWTGAAADTPVQIQANTFIEVGTLPGSVALASATGAISIFIPNYTDANRYKIVSADYVARGTTNLRRGIVSALWRSTAAVNRIQISHLATPVAGIVVSLYGVM